WRARADNACGHASHKLFRLDRCCAHVTRAPRWFASGLACPAALCTDTHLWDHGDLVGSDRARCVRAVAPDPDCSVAGLARSWTGCRCRRAAHTNAMTHQPIVSCESAT